MKGTRKERRGISFLVRTRTYCEVSEKRGGAADQAERKHLEYVPGKRESKESSAYNINPAEKKKKKKVGKQTAMTDPSTDKSQRAIG
jgi:hypothetical protein